jgi:hypothetical protein
MLQMLGLQVRMLGQFSSSLCSCGHKCLWHRWVLVRGGIGMRRNAANFLFVVVRAGLGRMAAGGQKLPGDRRSFLAV